VFAICPGDGDAPPAFGEDALAGEVPGDAADAVAGEVAGEEGGLETAAP
jgi:hypothetical protein